MAARLFRPGLFTNKVNIITGGGSGIGFGIAQDCSIRPFNEGDFSFKGF